MCVHTYFTRKKNLVIFPKFLTQSEGKGRHLPQFCGLALAVRVPCLLDPGPCWQVASSGRWWDPEQSSGTSEACILLADKLCRWTVYFWRRAKTLTKWRRQWWRGPGRSSGRWRCQRGGVQCWWKIPPSSLRLPASRCWKWLSLIRTPHQTSPRAVASTLVHLPGISCNLPSELCCRCRHQGSESLTKCWRPQQEAPAGWAVGRQIVSGLSRSIAGWFPTSPV